MIRILAILLAFLPTTVLGFLSIAYSQADEVIATLNGSPITLSEVEARVAFRIYRLRGNIYHILKRETRQIVDRQLLEAEAGRRGLTVDELVQKEVDEKIPPVEEAKVDQYLAEHPSDSGPDPLRRNRIRTYLSQKARIQRRLDLLASLHAKADFNFLMEPPQPPRTKISIEGQPWRGNPEAPVTLVHFASFNCELCVESIKLIQRLMDEYPDKIRWVHRNFLTINDEKALTAAKMGEIAFAQGKFWQYHDRLYGLAGKFEINDCDRIMADLGLKQESPASGNRPDRFLLKVKDDITAASRIGVTALPVIFVNGLYFSPTFPYERLKTLVVGELNGKPKSPDSPQEIFSVRPTQNQKGGDLRK